eukprot:756424-Pelagomonas_calceolata.AAC.5
MQTLMQLLHHLIVSASSHQVHQVLVSALTGNAGEFKDAETSQKGRRKASWAERQVLGKTDRPSKKIEGLGRQRAPEHKGAGEAAQTGGQAAAWSTQNMDSHKSGHQRFIQYTIEESLRELHCTGSFLRLVHSQCSTNFAVCGLRNELAWEVVRAGIVLRANKAWDKTCMFCGSSHPVLNPIMSSDFMLVCLFIKFISRRGGLLFQLASHAGGSEKAGSLMVEMALTGILVQKLLLPLFFAHSLGVNACHVAAESNTLCANALSLSTCIN